VIGHPLLEGAEFRKGAVRIVTETGKSVTEVAEDLGVNEKTLARRVSRAKRAEKATPEDKDTLIVRLTAENVALKKENSRPGWSASCPGGRCEKRYGCRCARSTPHRSEQWPRPRSAPGVSARPPRGRVRARPPNVMIPAAGVGHAGTGPPCVFSVELAFLYAELHGDPFRGQGAEAT
jgi:transposase